jgi:membrane-associated phospholipid phosphatase
MPGAHGVRPAPGFIESVVPLFHAHFGTPLLTAADIVTLPAQSVLSFVVVGAVALVLHRRGRTEAAVLWLSALVLATAIEVVTKHALVRPPLYRDGVHIVAFDSSWPSGHAARAAIIAAAAAVAWPRLRGVLALWLVAAVVLLELAGIHTPTDLAGGLLLAALFGAAALEAERSGALRRRGVAGLEGGVGLRRSAAPRRP